MEPPQKELDVLYQNDIVRDTFEAIRAGLCIRDYDYETILIPAIEGNLHGVVKYVTDIDLSDGDYDELFNWCLEQNLDNVCAYLLANCNVNPNSNHLVAACEEELVSTVAELLKVASIDPKADDSMCLRKAVLSGDHEIVDLLLQDGRANPCANGGEALFVAQNNGFDEIVDLLEADGRATPGG